MSEDQFTKLFKYVQEMRQEMNSGFERVDHQIADVRGAIGELSAQVKDYHEEVLAMSRQMDRLKEAILQIARETGVKLKVEL